MVKWLIISIAVITVFGLILLGFGKLLHDNETRVKDYQNELSLEQTAEDNSAQSSMPTMIPPPKIQEQESVYKTIIATNLTCVSDSQCLVVDIAFADRDCKVAVNTIGAALLSKAGPDNTDIGQCLFSEDELTASCKNNLCTLNP